jgi:CDP-glycerol glycerophosphotransferase (TagB/SpsB family)
MHTIIMAIYTGRDTRDILRTDVLKALKSEDIRVVIVSPAAKEKYFDEEFEDKNVVVESFYPPHSKLEMAYIGLMNALFVNTKFSKTINIKYIYFKKRNFSGSRMALSYILRNISSNLFSYKNYGFRRLLKRLNVLLFPDKQYKVLFEKYKPSLVFTTHTFYLAADAPILKRAIQNGVPTISMVPSWDNITAKGEMPVEIDKLIVWNERVKKEAIELHGYSPRDIFVAGVPQFDIYFTREGESSKEDFFKKIGADPEKKLITYTTGTPTLFPSEPDAIDILLRYILENKFIYPCQLLVRLNPRDNADRYEKFKNIEDIIIDNSWRPSKSFHDKWDPSKTDMVHLANTMLYSDVVINVASTITIDAACCDTPVVNIGFDGYQEKPYLDSVMKYYDYTHYKNIVRTGGVGIAKNKEELLKYINMYLENPKLDSAGRRRIVEEQCYYTDGQSGERVAKYILEHLKECENKK